MTNMRRSKKKKGEGGQGKQTTLQYGDNLAVIKLTGCRSPVSTVFLYILVIFVHGCMEGIWYVSIGHENLNKI